MPARTLTPACAASLASLKYPLLASMALTLLRSSMLRIVSVPLTPGACSSLLTFVSYSALRCSRTSCNLRFTIVDKGFARPDCTASRRRASAFKSPARFLPRRASYSATRLTTRLPIHAFREYFAHAFARGAGVFFLVGFPDSVRTFVPAFTEDVNYYATGFALGAVNHGNPP